MRILVISRATDTSLAPGLVFRSQIKYLTQHHEVELITCSKSAIDDPAYKNVKRIIYVPNIISDNIWLDRINNMGYKCLRSPIGDQIAKWKLRNFRGEYDVVLALCYYLDVWGLSVMQSIKKRTHGCKACYFVDPMPCPPWWGVKYFTNGLTKVIGRLSANLDFFASSNPKMLEFQKQYISPYCKRFATIYTPASIAAPITNIIKEPGNIQFLYVGSLSGLRTPQYLFEAFDNFLKKYPSAKLKFLGTSKEILRFANNSILPNIEFIPYTRDLSTYYKEATALIDIDANVDNDIYLSSKVTNYIFVDCPIICETGKNSPSRFVFNNIKSIRHCAHNSEELYCAMEWALTYEGTYEDRSNIKQLFHPRNLEEAIRELVR